MKLNILLVCVLEMLFNDFSYFFLMKYVGTGQTQQGMGIIKSFQRGNESNSNEIMQLEKLTDY